MDSAASGGTTEGKPASTEHDAAATTTTTTIGAAASAASGSGVHADLTTTTTRSSSPTSSSAAPSRYESQKRRDWNTFLQYLKNHKPPLTLGRCSGAHVIEFLKYLDQFGKTKVHVSGCAFFGHPKPPAPCACPLKQAWGSLDALIGRLRAAYEENGGRPESNPFGARAVRIYLREVREGQAKARGVPYEKKKRKRTSLPPPPPPPQPASSAAAAANVEPTKEIEVGPSSSTPTGTAEAGPSSAATPPASSSSSVVAATSSSV